MMAKEIKDLQKGFPMHTGDLKQMLDERIADSKDILDRIKQHPDYPKQENEHSAVDDARWNKKLYDFLLKL